MSRTDSHAAIQNILRRLHVSFVIGNFFRLIHTFEIGVFRLFTRLYVLEFYNDVGFCSDLMNWDMICTFLNFGNRLCPKEKWDCQQKIISTLENSNKALILFKMKTLIITCYGNIALHSCLWMPSPVTCSLLADDVFWQHGSTPYCPLVSPQ